MFSNCKLQALPSRRDQSLVNVDVDVVSRNAVYNFAGVEGHRHEVRKFEPESSV